MIVPDRAVLNWETEALSPRRGLQSPVASVLPMNAPSLTLEQREALLDGLAAALEAMIDQTCPDMGPLWVEATRAERAYLGEDATPSLGFEPSARYLGLSKGARSRYRGLAAWRHAVLWREIAPRLQEATFADAMRAVYFTPYPDNAPPYAWSERARDCPEVDRFESPTSLKHLAKEGCWEALRLLREERARLSARGDWAGELVSILMRPGARDSLRDVLKLEDLPPLERAR